MVKKMKKEKEFVRDVIMVGKVSDFYELSKTAEEELKAGNNNIINTVEVVEDIKLSEKEYCNLTNNFLQNNDKMFSGKGGVNKDGIAKAIRITCPNRKTFFVNPEGYDYARYVGLSLSDIISYDAYLVYMIFANKIKDKELFFNKIEYKENEKNK
jgi:hypothetical protein